MIKSIIFGLCLIVASLTSRAVGQEPDGSQRLLSVRGYLNAHWEYPHFIPDKNSDLKIMDFQIQEENWQAIYAAPVMDSMKSGTFEEVCFRIIGKGFLAPRRPSFMQPWEGNQLVFVKIRKMKKLKSTERCLAPSKMDDH